jgi:hypothetical protein
MNYQTMENWMNQAHTEARLFADTERLAKVDQSQKRVYFTIQLSKFFGFFARSLSRAEKTVRA